jgi:hypothetical protein
VSNHQLVPSGITSRDAGREFKLTLIDNKLQEQPLPIPEAVQRPQIGDRAVSLPE